MLLHQEVFHRTVHADATAAAAEDIAVVPADDIAAVDGSAAVDDLTVVRVPAGAAD